MLRSEYKILQPMKYATAKSKDVLGAALESDNYALQLKVDGASYVLAKDTDGSVHLYGDRISKKTGKIIDKIDNVPHLKAFAEEHFPAESQIIVEITCLYDWTTKTPTKMTRSNSKYVNSIMLCTPDKAIARQEMTEPCGAYVFDILFWDGETIYKQDFADRYNFLTYLQAQFPKYEWLSFAECIFEDKFEAISKWLASGEEGGVLKALHSQGRISAAHVVSEIGSTAKRPMHTTYKIKQVATVDVVICGIEFPTKEYTGKDPDNYKYRDEDNNPVNRLWALHMINAFQIGAYDETGELQVLGTVASGLGDNIRWHAFQCPEDFDGEVIEVECMSLDAASKSLRHPRFVRFRPDKDAKQCTILDIFR